MTSINVLGLPTSVKDTLIKASLDTVEDLLLYTPPGLSNDIPSARYKRQQVAKGVSSGGYDRLVNLTPSEFAFAYDQAAAHIFENKIAYGSAHDLLQDESWLSLGDPVLDAAVGGKGIMTRTITEIAGESAVGKTQLCLQLCLTVQLPESMGGLDGSVVWLSTEGKFPYNRLESMISQFVEKHRDDVPDMDADIIRENIYYDSMADQETQLHIFNYQLPILVHDTYLNQEDDDDKEENQEEEQPSVLRKKPIKLIIIDSITNNFRSELTVGNSAPDQAGNQGSKAGFRSSILQRSADICEIGLRLRTLADQYGLAVVCVNQVTDVIAADSTFHPPPLSFRPLLQTRDFPPAFYETGKMKKPALGLVWENTINARLVLQRTRLPDPYETDGYAQSASREPPRTLSVVFAPWSGHNRSSDPSQPGHCWYKIDETGVVGISTSNY
ncbi:P-loop containing nucleoside triphosphate hydrolase protein [Linnemannia elongata AG-77]|uniref:p-loop containing nucleoside triphosphate hydrolase protein n=1 Tax=Linnemannia elongata AG-77 TaxID=1314771 RepID=A0A197JIJ7_9FUNG|nr:P-loop containing nucleoside triphosphate hydrolase protein [Linnemannia elongata AG-77]